MFVRMSWSIRRGCEKRLIKDLEMMLRGAILKPR